MRAVVMSGFGTPDKARIADMPVPAINSDDVLIKVKAAGINPADWKECEGNLRAHYPAYPDPWILGFDAAGIIDKIGANVTNFDVGDRVMVLADHSQMRGGAFAEYLCAPAHLVGNMPQGISFVEAGAIPSAAITGHQALFRKDKGALKQGDHVLIHGASGGIGSFALQFAKAEGLHVAATCRATNADYVRRLGADLVIDYMADDILATLRRWAPEGVDAIIDCVSAGSFPHAFDALVPGGRLVSIGTILHDGDVAADTAEAERRGLKKIISKINLDNLHEQFKPVAAMIAAGNVVLPLITTYPLERAVEALTAMKQGHVTGKIVLEMQ